MRCLGCGQAWRGRRGVAWRGVRDSSLGGREGAQEASAEWDLRWREGQGWLGDFGGRVPLGPEGVRGRVGPTHTHHHHHCYHGSGASASDGFGLKRLRHPETLWVLGRGSPPPPGGSQKIHPPLPRSSPKSDLKMSGPSGERSVSTGVEDLG